MTFIPNKQQRIVPGSGNRLAKVAIVGEAPGSYEALQGKPFVGPAGGVLEQCLHAAGLIRSEVYLTNVVKVQPPGNEIKPYFNPLTGQFTSAGMEWVENLREELNSLEANIFVACGATALAALTCDGIRGMKGITKYRGYLFETKGLAVQRKFLPCIHPSAALRGMYIYRHLIASDLKKARLLSDSPNLNRPERQLIYNFSMVSEVLEWLDYFATQPIVGFDTEVLNYELSCISFCTSPSIAISIPLDNRWTDSEEAQIWLGIQKVLGNPRSIKIVQNGAFDLHFLITRCGIEVKGEIRDTMIGYHIMYPELMKGLAFLGSIYCGSQQYWKTVSFDNIKEES